jgi:hypothetical protein
MNAAETTPAEMAPMTCRFCSFLDDQGHECEGKLRHELAATQQACNLNLQAAERCAGERDAAIARAEKAEKFKAYVHKRLDEMAIPTDPKGEHSAQGCRVGERLDIAAAVVDIVREFAAEPCAYGDGCPSNAGTRHGRCIQCKAKVALRIGPDDCADCHGDRVHGCAPFCTGMKFPTDRTVPLVDGGTATLPVESGREVMPCHGCDRTCGWLSLQPADTPGTCPICKAKFVSHGGGVLAKVSP